MIKISESATQSGQIVNQLAQASDRIGEIITVIDDIAVTAREFVQFKFVFN